MYNEFFGLSEHPFNLVPDPHYLYLSKTHEDVLAHLEYALNSSDGFIEIVGEVGTGKTTLCRAFLENLASNVEAAYIFNPALDSLQLLQAINQEFGINAEADNAKDLIDSLNVFLIEAKQKKKKIILLIDEAQNLSLDVLEKLRLLSNLETTREKLLHIVLVGQPELDDLLARKEMRQLHQRISLNCRLRPLNFEETCRYIDHRLRLASTAPKVILEKTALRAIFQYSKGVPRLTNILASRALLTAFGLNTHRVTRRVVSLALRELKGQKTLSKKYFVGWARASGVFFCLAIISFAIITYFSEEGRDISFKTENNFISGKIFQKILPARMVSSENSVQTADYTGNVKQTNEIEFGGNAPHTSTNSVSDKTIVERLSATDFEQLVRQTAFDVIQLWGVDPKAITFPQWTDRPFVFFREAAWANALEFNVIFEDYEQIKNLDLPAVVELRIASKELRYLRLAAIQDAGVELVLRDGRMAIDRQMFLDLWTGRSIIVWKNFLQIDGTIPREANEENVAKLKSALSLLGNNDLEFDSRYGAKSRQAIRMIQQQQLLKVDGVVGPLTKIALYRALGKYEVPSLRKEADKSLGEGV